MTLTLLVLAMIAAANPFRAVAARPADARYGVVVAAIAATGAFVLCSVVVSGPLLDLVDVTGPSARIAAGIALLVVALKDAFLAPPAAEPAPRGWRSGVVPLAFPVIFSPALALLAIAGAAERGAAVTLAAAAIALAPVALMLVFGPRTGPVRAMTASAGALGTGLAALVVLDGVYAI
jgi:small neutral amino acid transporter SnatA (MarC family)